MLSFHRGQVAGHLLFNLLFVTSADFELVLGAVGVGCCASVRAPSSPKTLVQSSLRSVHSCACTFVSHTTRARSSAPRPEIRASETERQVVCRALFLAA